MKIRWLLAGLAILVAASDLHPCAPAPPAGTFVYIQEESAIIVWDSANRIQHFIRRASFRSDAPDFGFLVPTPTKPELSEVSNDAFQVLAEIMRPRVVEDEERGIRPTWLIGEFLYMKRGVETAAPRQVRLLQFKQVAGYDAAVLEADDAAALNDWLKEHGYPSSAALQQWFEPYIAMKWKITAFKITGDRTGSVGSSTVRMSFAAEQPFFPYREPQSENGGQESRSLQVLLLSDARMEGAIGAGGAWPGRLQWADRISTEDQSRLMKQLGLEGASLPRGLWLNAFEDPSNPRPGKEDLFFRVSKSQSPQVPPPYVITVDRRIPIPIDVIIIVVVTIFFVMRLRRQGS